MSETIDLDVLMPPEKIVIIKKRKINIGFIPAGATWDIQRISDASANLNQKEIDKGGEETKKGLDLTADLCAAFCKHQYEDMDSKWFKSNLNAIQIKTLADEIVKVLNQTLKDVEAYSKNVEAGQ